MGISSALGSSALLPAGLGFRNLIINGNFDINQRGATSETADGKFVHDRWILVRGGDGTTTYSTQAFTAGNPIPNYEPTNYARLVTTGQTTSVVYSILTQRIESVRSCAGQQVTISFYAKANSGTPKVSVEVGQSFGSGGSADVNTYLGQVTLSTSWARYTVTGVVPSISGKTIGTSSYLSLFLWVSAGSTYNSRTNSMGIQTNTFDFWGVQLEQNYQPTPFEQRPIGVELQLCQRYYYRKTFPSVSPATLIIATLSAYSATSLWGGMVLKLPMTMRTNNPTVAVSARSDFNAWSQAASTSYSWAANTLEANSDYISCWSGINFGTPGFTAGTALNFAAANNNAWIEASAEL